MGEIPRAYFKNESPENREFRKKKLRCGKKRKSMKRKKSPVRKPAKKTFKKQKPDVPKFGEGDPKKKSKRGRDTERGQNRPTSKYDLVFPPKQKEKKPGVPNCE